MKSDSDKVELFNKINNRVMIQEESQLEVADNSGAKRLKCIRVLGGTGIRYANVGSRIICTVTKANPNGTVKKSEVVTAVVVRTTRKIQRKDGTVLSFSENACFPECLPNTRDDLFNPTDSGVMIS